MRYEWRKGFLADFLFLQQSNLERCQKTSLKARIKFYVSDEFGGVKCLAAGLKKERKKTYQER